MKIRPVEVEMFHAERGRHITMLTVTFRNFAKSVTS